MYEDKVPRLIYYHDTWISIDIIKGCPYGCVYCVLRHSEINKSHPEEFTTVNECVHALQNYRFYVPNKSYLAIGNETDMFHPSNQSFLVDLLSAFSSANIRNPITLITKSPLNRRILDQMAGIPNLKLIFALSYSGLGQKYEPNFNDSDHKENFELVREYSFPIFHYWRPILQENAQIQKVREMLSFVSGVANATVFIGLKLHPELNRIIAKDHSVPIPDKLIDNYGEWLDPQVIELIYQSAYEICPTYPLYRHTACAMASILAQHNRTGTIYREDICPPSQCKPEQRSICRAAKSIPTVEQIQSVISHLDKSIEFERMSDQIIINGHLSQEEYAFLLHQLNCPIRVQGIRFENLYRGSIFDNQKAIS